MSTTARWSPGTVPVAVASRGLVALDGDPAVLEDLWADLEEGRELGELLQHLARAHDNNVFALPDFVAVVMDGDRARAAARGRFRLTLHTASGPVELAAAEVIAWDETHAEAVRGVTLHLAGDDDGDDARSGGTTASWPVRSGVVTACWVAVGEVTAPVGGTLPAPRVAGGPVRREEPAAVESDGSDLTGTGLASADPAVPSILDTGMTLGPEALEALEAQVSGGRGTETQASGGRGAEAQASGGRGAAAPEDRSGAPGASGAVEARAGRATGLPDPAPTAPTGSGPDGHRTGPLPPPPPDAPGTSAGAGDPAAQAPATQAEDDYFGHLFESTRATTVEEAAIRAARTDDVDPLARPASPGSVVTDVPAPGAPSPVTGPATGPEPPTPPALSTPGHAATTTDGWQHDGRTVSAAQLRAAREALATGQPADGAPVPGLAQAPLPGPAVPAGGPQVLAAFCVAGHPNPVHATSCRQCGATITASTGHVTRPPLGVLRCSTGASAVLDADVVVGRLPQGTNRPGGPAPHLMAVPSPGKAISKSHCAVRVQEWDVAVEDLGSTNGTFLLRPGESPRRVPEHSSVFLRTGDVIDLGDGITLTLEREP